jgi:hypothetical protein
MAKRLVLAKFAVRVIGINMPGNWDRPVGYEGHAHFVSVYWDCAGDDVYITDGVVGRSGGAWWLYKNLVEHEAHHQIMAALMAYGVANAQSTWLLGNKKFEASYGLILDRYQRSLWVARLPLIAEFLSFQHPLLGGGTRALSLSLVRDKETIRNQQFIRPSTPCHCERGWILASDYYLPCPECERSGRILHVPDIVNH